MSFAVMNPKYYAALVILCISFLPPSNESKKILSIRDQLRSLQKETGLTLESFSRGITRSGFARKSHPLREEVAGPAGMAQNGSLSPHGTKIAFEWVYRGSPILDSRLAVVMRNGSNLREYPEIRNPETFCWSPDESKIVIYSESRKGALSGGKLYVLELSTGKAQQVREGVSFVTPQCWSPDGQRIVFGIPQAAAKHEPAGSVGLYDLDQKKLFDLGQGAYPTWSPDGKWIAFYDGNSYYLVEPSGKGKKLFFSAKNATTGLLWSPDSIFVAYGVCCRYLVLEGENVRIRVRRLIDNAEDWVTEVSRLLEDINLNWIQPLEPSPGRFHPEP